MTGRLGIFVVALVTLAALSQVSSGLWTQSDSLPSLYNAVAAYCEPNKISSWNCGFCSHNPGVKFVGFLEYRPTSVFGYVSIFNNEVVVAYRGSECIMNWVNNLDAFKEAYPHVTGALVHKGFYAAFKHVQVQTRNLVAIALKNCPACHTIRCTGHSLGAALASHAAADLSFLYIPHSSAPRIKLTTFGSPRVGNEVFSHWLDSRTSQSFRMTHNADPVPHLPPKMMSFHHVATEIFEKHGKYKECNGSGEDPRCADGVILPLKISDHLNYMGVDISGGMKNNCQPNGPNCKVFLEQMMNTSWEARFPDIHN